MDVTAKAGVSEPRAVVVAGTARPAQLEGGLRQAHGAPTRPDTARLRVAAQEFEAVFIHQMLKTMRWSLPVGGPLAPGSGQKMYQDMLDDEMARSMARGGGLGLADVLVRDLLHRMTGEKNSSSPVTSWPISQGEGRGNPEGGAR